MKVRILQLDPKAVKPTYAKPGDACFDLYAIEPAYLHAHGGDELLRTGLAVEVPEGFVMLIHSRSGHGANFQVSLANSTGVIDSGYRGEVKVALINHGLKDFAIDAGDRIAQAMIVPFVTAELEWSDALSQTERGAGGFGHTGKN